MVHSGESFQECCHPDEFIHIVVVVGETRDIGESNLKNFSTNPNTVCLSHVISSNYDDSSNYSVNVVVLPTLNS
jgi:hypothetical protein